MVTSETGALSSNKMDCLPKYEKLKYSMLSRINSGKWVGGGRVPSESQLRGEFDVSSTTARRCLDELAKDGYLYRVQGKGTFVSHIARACGKKSIGVLCNGLASIKHPFLSSLLGGIESSFDLNKYIIEVVPCSLIDQADSPAKAMSFVTEQRKLEGLFVVSPVPDKWLKHLVDKKFPVISLNVDYKTLPITSVVINSDMIYRNSLEYLLKLGHRRICCFMGRFKEPTSDVRESYEHASMQIKFLSQQSAYADAEFSIVSYPWFDADTMYISLWNILSGPERPEAIMVNDEAAALLVNDLARKLGIRIPEDLSFILAGGAKLGFASVTCCMGSIENLTWRATRVMEQLLENEKPVRTKEYLEGRLIVGETTDISKSV